MADLAALAERQIIAAFNGPLKPFLKEVSFEFLQAEGEYDPDTDTISNSYEVVGPKLVPCLRPTVEEMSNYGVEAAHQKIIIPKSYLPREMQASDRIKIGTEEWTLSKTLGVPGEVVYIVFVKRT
jgi:hypothetical protein